MRGAKCRSAHGGAMEARDLGGNDGRQHARWRLSVEIGGGWAGLGRTVGKEAALVVAADPPHGRIEITRRRRGLCRALRVDMEKWRIETACEQKGNEALAEPRVKAASCVFAAAFRPANGSNLPRHRDPVKRKSLNSGEDSLHSFVDRRTPLSKPATAAATQASSKFCYSPNLCRLHHYNRRKKPHLKRRRLDLSALEASPPFEAPPLRSVRPRSAAHIRPPSKRRCPDLPNLEAPPPRSSHPRSAAARSARPRSAVARSAALKAPPPRFVEPN
ncbi:hypothetical protein Salat_2101200 [Sesamum alatum]|uniref:Uncharacterized protein n=1 Tax=Sesamum alatum TaxID=300844 RepID=A0AAE2CGM3_9LAMI|nr:hypothetical protein Salat_2101200 [Sesamum alatum]